MGPPDGAEHAKPKPVVTLIVVKGAQARGGEEEPPRLLWQGPEMTTNGVRCNASTYHLNLTYPNTLTDADYARYVASRLWGTMKKYCGRAQRGTRW